MSEADDFFDQGSEQEATLLDQEQHKDSILSTRAKAMMGVLALITGVWGGIHLEDRFNVLNGPSGDFTTDISDELDALDRKCDKFALVEAQDIYGSPSDEVYTNEEIIKKWNEANSEGQAYTDEQYYACVDTEAFSVVAEYLDGPPVFEPFELRAG